MNSGMLKLVLGLIAICGIVTTVNIFYKKMHQDYKTETALLSVGSDSELVQGVFIRDGKVVVK